MYSTSFISSIDQIDPTQLNELVGDYPFLSHEFLMLLEHSGVTGEGTGWHVSHCVVYKDQQLVAFLPLYLKYHSYGEYVFDHAWADAYFQYGFDYYPKLVSAIPFTPITGPRLCCHLTGSELHELVDLLISEIKLYAVEHLASSYHCLFPSASENAVFSSHLDLPRRAVHFQWQNRNYQNFDHFLERFTSRKRKNVRKERLGLKQNGIEFDVLVGADIKPEHWDTFYTFYVVTYAKRSGHGGYLNKDFFMALSNTMASSVVLVLARRQGKYIAGALNFRGGNKLYGRYWGAIESHSALHFEACYYQGIEFCITNNIEVFDPGVQGEHKLQRGFEPMYTYSSHWIRDDAFRSAIQHSVKREDGMIQDYFHQCQQALPFKQ